MSNYIPYYPKHENDQPPWLINLKTKAPGYVAELESNALEINRVVAICTTLLYIKVDWMALLNSYVESCYDFRDDVEEGDGPTPTVPTPPAFSLPPGAAPLAAGLLDEVFEIIRRWKTSPLITDPIETDLRIVGHTVAPTSADPVLKATVEAGFVLLRVVKKGHKGVIFQSQRQGAEAWETLATTTTGKWTDIRPNLTPGQAEWREYRAVFWDGTVATGDFSAEVRITK